MLRKVLVFALLQVFIFSKQCKSHDSSMEIAGLTAKLNQRGINFMTEQINENAEKFVSTTTIPDFPLPLGTFINVNLTNLNVTNLELGDVKLMTMSPNEVKIELAKSSLKIKGSFSATFFGAPFGSNFSADIDDFYIKGGVALGRNDWTNTLTVASTTCNASVGGVSFNFFGDQMQALRVGLNAWQAVPGNDVAELVGTSICPWMDNFILEALNTLLSNFTKTFDLPLNTTVDLSLTQDPNATSTSLQLFANGTCFPTEDPNFEVQLDSLTLPALQDSTKMIQGAISQNVLNTYGQSIFSQGYLNLTFEVENVLSFINSFLPDNAQLEISGLDGTCINASVVDPSKPLTFEFLPDFAPRFGIKDGSFTLLVGYKTLLRYHTSSGSSDVIALDATYTIAGNVYATGNKIGWNIFCANIQVSDTCFSNNAIQVIKNYAVSLVNMLINNLIPSGLLGNLNELTVPVVLGYSPDNLEVILKEGALEFAGDIALAASIVEQ